MANASQITSDLVVLDVGARSRGQASSFTAMLRKISLFVASVDP